MSFSYSFSRTPGGTNEWTNPRVVPVYDGSYPAAPPQMFPQPYPMAIHPPSSRQSYTPPHQTQNPSQNQFQMFSQFQPQFQPLQHQQYPPPLSSSPSSAPSQQPPSDPQHFSSQIPPQSQQPSKSPFSSSSPAASPSSATSTSQGQQPPKASSPPPSSSSAPAPTSAAPSSTSAPASTPSQKQASGPTSSSADLSSSGSANRPGSPDHHHHHHHLNVSGESEDSERTSELEHEKAQGDETFEGGEEGGDGEEEGEEVVIKLLVPNSMVGSIIGKGGATIKEITVQTSAKIHIAQGDEISPERMVTITGTLANASVAQYQISLKMLEEAFAEFKDVETDLPLEQRISLQPLKLVIPNSVVGRLIGKGGTNLKRTMAETDTYLTCSKEDEFPRLVGERVVSIIGNIKNQRRAQNAIMQQIRQYVQSQPSSTPSSSTSSAPSSHLQGTVNGSTTGASKPQEKSSEGSSSAPSSSSRPAPSQASPPSSSSSTTTSSSQSFSSKPTPSAPASSSSSSSTPTLSSSSSFRIPPELQDQEETLCVQVSSSLVGAIIGKKGATVKEIGTRSGCNIRVARNEEVDHNAAYRPITLFGSITSLCKAQQMIYAKLQEAPSAATSGVEQLLRVHITIPNEVVGRVIGKKGSQVKKITEMSGAKIIINQDEEDEANGTLVSVLGNLESNLTAQIRIFEILSFHSGDQGN